MRVRRVMQAALAAVAMSAGAVSVAASAGASGGALASVAVQDFAPNAPYAQGLTSDPQGNLFIASCGLGVFEIAAGDPSHAAALLVSTQRLSCPTGVTYYAGSLYVSDENTHAVWRVSTDGSTLTKYFSPSSVFYPSQVAFGTDGTMYVAGNDPFADQSIYAVAPGGASDSVLATPSSFYCPWGMAVHNGSLLVGGECATSIDTVALTGGPLTMLFDPNAYSPALYARGNIALDPAGNAFFLAGSDCGNTPGQIMEIPAGSNTAVVVPNTGFALGSCNYGAGITWSNGYVYFENGGGLDLARFPDPISTSVTHLAVTRDWTTLTGTWDSAPGAISYTCTLLYGFGGPSSFTTIVRTPTCSFYGLTPSTNFGISVVANYASGSSSPVGAFPLQAPTIITCVRGHSKVHVRAWNPRCPAHYHRVGRPVQG